MMQNQQRPDKMDVRGDKVHRRWGDKRTRVAAHGHAETIPAAMRPGLRLLDALLNSSALFGEKPV